MQDLPSTGTRGLALEHSNVNLKRRCFQGSNLETHVECVPRPRQWGAPYGATKPALVLSFYSGANRI